jgi:hypothetical protein
MTRTAFATLALLALALPASAQQGSIAEAPSQQASGGSLHEPFTSLLATYVEAGVVDYAGLKQSERELDRYLASLGGTDPAGLEGDALKAFWINAYNAFTLKLILDHYPEIDSIKDIPSRKRWKAERWEVAGQAYSLDQIEHELLRPMGDPRIHAAINCASRSCPDLLEDAFLPETLDEQLDAAMRAFLADETKGLRVASEPGLLWGTNHRLYLSSIFDWFDEDFEKHSGTVVDYVIQYAPARAVEFVRQHRKELDVEHMDYDWSLNGG